MFDCNHQLYMWLITEHHDDTHLCHFHREKELAKVTIKKEDVELIVSVQKCIRLMSVCKLDS